LPASDARKVFSDGPATAGTAVKAKAASPKPAARVRIMERSVAFREEISNNCLAGTSVPHAMRRLQLLG
jgi:hypothetical protein